MIVQTPNTILTQKAKPIEKVDKKIIQIVNEMKKTLISTKNPKGVGLAAPQIGISLRLFIMRPREKDPVSIFINPAIIWQSEEQDVIRRPKKNKSDAKDDKRLEGCLSINNIWGSVKRAVKVKLEYQNIEGKPQEKEFSDFEATIVQHEVDHLDGILFTRRVIEQKGKLFRIEKSKDEEEELIEIEI